MPQKWTNIEFRNVRDPSSGVRCAVCRGRSWGCHQAGALGLPGWVSPWWPDIGPGYIHPTTLSGLAPLYKAPHSETAIKKVPINPCSWCFFSSENMKALAMIIILRLTRTISGGESFENFHFSFDLTCEKWDNLKIIKLPCCWYHFINPMFFRHTICESNKSDHSGGSGQSAWDHFFLHTNLSVWRSLRFRENPDVLE